MLGKCFEFGSFESALHKGILINLIDNAGFTEFLTHCSILLYCKAEILHKHCGLSTFDRTGDFLYNRLFQFYLCHELISSFIIYRNSPVETIRIITKVLRRKTQDLMISHFENAYAFHEKSNPRQAFLSLRPFGHSF